MKRVGKFILVLFFIMMCFSGAANAQNEPSGMGMGMGSPALIAKPSYETIEGGLKIEVWIMTKVKEGSEQVNAGTDEEKPSTHNVLVGIKDAAEGRDFQAANVNLEILPPSGITEMVQLELMSDQFGGGIPLVEKGEYNLKLNISTADGRKVEAPFSYKVNR